MSKSKYYSDFDYFIPLPIIHFFMNILQKHNIQTQTIKKATSSEIFS